MSALMGGQSRVPPGFRFHPTDEELVGYYLTKKVASKKIDLDVIHDIDLYKLEPWDLNERCRIGSAEQTEWYFFSHKDKKYPTGTRTNRATAAGFWKATGRDKAIHTKFKLIGMRKTLVFYKGRAPNGQKTDWIMHEYRLEDESNNGNDDGWVVCRVFKKRNTHRNQEREVGSIYGDQIPLPELDSPTKAIIGDHSYTQSMICKQEIEVDDGYGNTHDPFSQLPQLESPKISGNPPPTMKGYYSGNPARNDHPSHFCLDAASFGTKSMYTERLTHFNNEPVTDWRMVDRLAAAQLSHEEALKDIRYSSGNSDPMGDVALLLRLSKQHPSDYSSSDIDLWSFGR